MTKRSYKMPAQPEKESAGCMWGLISLFNFRQVPATPRLLSDRKRGNCNGYSRVSLDSLDSLNSKHDMAVDEGSRPGKVDVGMASVKELIEEEMSEKPPQKQIPNSEIQALRSENQQRQNRKLRNIENLTLESLDNHESDYSNANQRSSLNFDLAALLIELYSYNKNQETDVDSNNMINLCTTLRTISEKMHNNLDEPDSLLCQKHHTLRKALADVEEAIISQNPVDEKQLIGPKSIQSQELVDALEILNSNKDLLLKLLRDPESILFNHDQDFQGSQVEKSSKWESDKFSEKIRLLEENGCPKKHEESNSKELLHKQSKYSFFWKKDKTKGTKLLTENQNPESLSRIVILKPSLASKESSSIMIDPSSSPQSHHTPRLEEDGERIFSYFSLSEIKRRLKRVFGASRKERHAISMDGVLHKIPIGQKHSIKNGKEITNETFVSSSPRKSFSNDEKSSDTSAIGKANDKKINLEEREHNDVASAMAGHLIYKEGKKHLVEMLDAGVQTDDLPTDEISKPLGNFLSLLEYSESPRPSPGRQKETVSSPEKTGISILEQLMPKDAANYMSPLRQNLEVSSSVDPNEEVHLQEELVETHMQKKSYTGENLIGEGSIEIAEAEDISSSLAPNLLDVVSRTEIDQPDTVLSDDMLQSLNQSEASPRFLVTENSLVAESKTIKSERQSPLSLRENFFTEARVQPRKISFNDSDTSSRILTSLDVEGNLRTFFEDNEVRSKYVEAVLQASGLSRDEYSERWLLEDQLLDPYLIDEVGISSYPQRDDRMLLFDCINEVLVELQWRYFKFNPTLSFIKSDIQPAPFGKRLIQEVNKGIKGRLRTPFPNILEQIIEKDLDSGSWIDLRLEVDDIVIEIWDTVLDDLVDETVFDLWF